MDIFVLFVSGVITGEDFEEVQADGRRRGGPQRGRDRRQEQMKQRYVPEKQENIVYLPSFSTQKSVRRCVYFRT